MPSSSTGSLHRNVVINEHFQSCSEDFGFALVHSCSSDFPSFTAWALLEQSSFFFFFFSCHAFTHLHNRLSSGQGSRAGLRVLMGGIGFHCPQIHISIRRVGTTVQDTACSLKWLTHTIPIVHIAQAWFPCKDIGDDPFTNQAPGLYISCPRWRAGHLALGFPTTRAWQAPWITPAADAYFVDATKYALGSRVNNVQF